MFHATAGPGSAPGSHDEPRDQDGERQSRHDVLDEPGAGEGGMRDGGDEREGLNQLEREVHGAVVPAAAVSARVAEVSHDDLRFDLVTPSASDVSRPQESGRPGVPAMRAEALHAQRADGFPTVDTHHGGQ